MESLVAVSLASNVVQFVDFAFKLVSIGKELYEYGAVSEHSDLERITDQLISFNKILQESLKSRSSSTGGPTESEKVSFLERADIYQRLTQT
jgi:hypothetical protein